LRAIIRHPADWHGQRGDFVWLNLRLNFTAGSAIFASIQHGRTGVHRTMICWYGVNSCTRLCSDYNDDIKKTIF